MAGIGHLCLVNAVHKLSIHSWNDKPPNQLVVGKHVTLLALLLACPMHVMHDQRTIVHGDCMTCAAMRAAPMLDALATGLREVKSKRLVGRALALDAFFDAMLRSRISRRVIAEQHLQLSQRKSVGRVGLRARGWVVDAWR
jgi:hypothetical protein